MSSDTAIHPNPDFTQRVHSIVAGQPGSSQPLAFKLRILFVDDEKRILDGLRRMLRTRRDHWEMTFLEDPEEAVRWIANNSVHVVVSDMRMPGMDGIALLKHTQQLRPNALRFILSGNASRNEVVRSVGPVHQYLSKPCDPEVLQQVILHTLQLRSLVGGGKADSGLHGLEELPSCPQVLERLRALTHDPESCIRDIGDLIRQDPGLVTRLLKLVNSAYFGLKRTIGDVEDAIAVIGMDGIEGLALAHQVHQSAHVPEGPLGTLYHALWDHSLRVASLARRIAQDLGGERNDMETAFFAGLMHDVGIHMLISHHPKTYTRLIEASQRYGVALHQAEERVLHCSHPQVAAYLLGTWGVADDVLEAVFGASRPSPWR